MVAIIFIYTIQFSPISSANVLKYHLYGNDNQLYNSLEPLSKLSEP